jgi:ABC-type antimicrobial peptide transport system permease subunit
MACVGLYGTMAYNVARRSNEIGIRMALGAARARIVWMVLREVLILCLFGGAVGLIAVFQATTVVQAFLFNVKPRDPVALVVSATILLTSVLLAGFLPARRAASINPVDALRAE